VTIAARPIGAGAGRPNVICDCCSATFYTGAVSNVAHRPSGRCEYCGGTLWPILVAEEREAPHPPVGVRDLEAYRARRRRR
jgi:hypothetical protein